MSEYPIPEDLTATQKLRRRAVTHEEGAASIQRLINSHFNNDNGARCSIPARADDDDIVASDYAKECRERIAKQDAEIERLTKEVEEQIGYSIKLQRLLESLKREATPYPELHHHKMVEDIKAENASLKAQVERLSAPLSDEEVYTFERQSAYYELSRYWVKRAIQHIIAARAAKETEEKG